MPTGKVKEVVDGDTFRLQNDELVRLANVNAPEPGRPRSQKARKDLQRLVPPGTTVGISPKAKSYGRTVARVTKNGKSVNDSMRRKGYK